VEWLEHARVRLLGYANVIGVGVGWKETGGCVTEVVALRVYVRCKVPCDALGEAERIPSRLGDWQTDVIPALTGVLAGSDAAVAPLAPGVAVSNLRGLAHGDASGPGVLGLGTLGCLAFDHRVRTRREIVLVSNRHVLLAHGARLGDPVYRPRLLAGGSTQVVVAGEPIAEISDEGREGNHRFGYRGEPDGDYFVDCASARLLAPRDLRSPVRAVGRLQPMDVLAGRAPRVRKLGGTSGATEGRVVDVSAPVETQGQQRMHNLVVRATAGRFLEPGDSGALLLDARDRAIGLLWGRSDRDPSLAYACHLHPVLDCLHLTLMTRGLV
jgi:hypothetical protein